MKKIVSLLLRSILTAQFFALGVNADFPETEGFSSSADWSYLKEGTGSEWLSENFDYSGWIAGAAPLGFGSITGTLPIATTILKGNSCTNVYLIRTFTISDPGKIDSIKLTGELDDGARVYINGVEAGTINLSTNGTPNTVGSAAYSFSLDLSSANIVVGTNRIQINLLNATATSSDIYWAAALTVTEAVPEEPDDPLNPIKTGSKWQYLPRRAAEVLSDSVWVGTMPGQTVGWKTGATPIGFRRDGTWFDIATNLSEYDRDLLHVYLSREIMVENPASFVSATATVKYDDGVVLYVNGVQAALINVSSAHAIVSTVDTPAAQTTVGLPLNLFRGGTNIIQAKLINAGNTSSDILFDMDLKFSVDRTFSPKDLVLTPGADESELNLSWYTEFAEDEGDLYIYPNTSEEKLYLDPDNRGLKTLVEGQEVRYADSDGVIIYKIPLDNTQTDVTAVLDISGNYQVSLSADAQNWILAESAPGLAGVGKTDNTNRCQLPLSLNSYLDSEFIYIKITDQTPTNRWGGVVYSIMLTYDTYPRAATVCAVEIAEKSSLIGGEFPANAPIFSNACKTATTGFISNQVTVTGLTDNTEYVYRVKTGNSTWSAVYDYQTRDSGNFSFILAGDPQIGASSTERDVQKYSGSIQVALSHIPDASFILSTGDQVDSAANESQYDALLSLDINKTLPFAPTIGNHDTGASLFGYHFNTPNQTTNNTTQAGGNYYYSYGETLFIVLNSNHNNALQYRDTLSKAVEAHPDVRWKIVSLHHDIYGAGSHVVDSDTVALRQTLTPLFDQFGIDVVLTGHDHSYARSYFLTASGQVQVNYDSDGNALLPEGTLYMTAGTSSGSKYYPLLSETPGHVAFSSQSGSPVISTVEIDHDFLTISTYDIASNTLIDSLTISKAQQVVSLHRAKSNSENVIKAKTEQILLSYDFDDASTRGGNAPGSVLTFDDEVFYGESGYAIHVTQRQSYTRGYRMTTGVTNLLMSGIGHLEPNQYLAIDGMVRADSDYAKINFNPVVYNFTNDTGGVYIEAPFSGNCDNIGREWTHFGMNSDGEYTHIMTADVYNAMVDALQNDPSGQTPSLGIWFWGLGTEDYANYFLDDIRLVLVTNQVFSSDIYTLDGEYLTNVSPETTVEFFISSLQTADFYLEVKKNGNTLTTGLVGTGMQLEVYSGATLVKSFTIVIFGDVTGDGRIGITDLIVVKKYLSQLYSPDNAVLKAMEASRDTDPTIGANDLVAIRKDLLRIASIRQW